MTTEPIHPFRHHGQTGAAIRLALGNLGLDIVTLSFWRFWGRTRMRKMLWGDTTAWDDPVEYTGTGGELFKGFLVVLVLIYLPLVAGFAWAQALMAENDPRAVSAISTLYLLLILLVAAGTYRARRYQLSRTMWRGIRGGQTGSALHYALLSLAMWLTASISLGWALPWGEMMLARYRWNHTRFGDKSFRCDANTKGLYGRFALIWLSGLFFILVASFLGWAAADMGKTAGLTEGVVIALGSVVAVLVAVFMLVLPWARYRAAVLANTATGISFDGHRFAAPVRTWPLTRLVLGNMLISFFSLGILRPWAAQRMFHFACQVIAIDGVPDFATVRQSLDTGPASGEGLIAVLDGAGEF